MMFYIPKQIGYTLTSVPALFCCMKLIRPCLGYQIKDQQETSFAQSSNCTKETCTVEGKSMYILRHQNCMRFLEIKLSSLPACKKCAKFVTNKKQYKNNSEEENKENISEISTEEIMQKLKNLCPNLHENQLKLIQSQIIASNLKHKAGMRWDKDVICMALSLFNRNPAAYRDLTSNNWLNLPSESLINIYKNAVQQRPGIVYNMMVWMNREAKRQKTPIEGYYGGIILDEMAILEDLQIVHTKSKPTLFGLPENGEDIKRMQALNEGKLECTLANHVQQYVFSGLSGFRWPFANFPNLQAPPADIFITTWMCIESLYNWEFKPIYCCMDGSANNRAFLKMHFASGNPLASKMVARCYKNPTKKIIFLMDPCHLIKKIRNSVLSSGFLQSHQRLLTVNGHVIIWKMWIDAFNWDLTNSFRVHHKLSDEHIFPTNSPKMRNKLAFDVLDSEMLNLMKCYSQTLTLAAQIEMESVLQFLQYTSILVSLFTDSRPIKEMSDSRLKLLSECFNWFKAWEKQQISDDDKNKRYKSLMTMETREDLDFMYYGFMSLVEMCINEIKTEVVPSRINSDIIENIFCQQRSLYHGATTNPNYNEYRTGVNSIILGQTTTSKKANACQQTAKPLALGLPPKKKVKK